MSLLCLRVCFGPSVSLPSASHGPPRLPWHLGPQGSGVVPTLSPQVFGIYVNPGYGPMAPPAVHCEPSQPHSTAQILRNTSEAPRLALNQVAEATRDQKTWCFRCKRKFHARKALNRHIDDMRSGKTRKSCDYPNCDFTYVRKAQNGNSSSKGSRQSSSPSTTCRPNCSAKFPISVQGSTVRCTVALYIPLSPLRMMNGLFFN
jgi:hypothetical protein